MCPYDHLRSTRRAELVRFVPPVLYSHLLRVLRRDGLSVLFLSTGKLVGRMRLFAGETDQRVGQVVTLSDLRVHSLVYQLTLSVFSSLSACLPGFNASDKWLHFIFHRAGIESISPPPIRVPTKYLALRP